MSQSLLGEFEGTQRFRLEEHLGTGTSGEVYRAYDTKHRSRVALKTLHRADPAAIYRFKTEFRALADVAHPNLVQLYELLLDGQRWFFTMELIEGCDFLEYCHGPGLPADGEPPSDPDSVRDLMRQLATGLSALHAAGKLHCDIKPSNIRVAHDGRLVLLDFGLVQELFPTHGDQTVDAELAGTPAYMSPEQAAGQRLTEASDWYSAGVVLFEALTGKRPITGNFLEVLQKKQTVDPPAPRELVETLPEDLSKLTHRLLKRDPARRPRGEATLRMLGEASDRSLASHRTTSGGGAPFVGREEQFEALDESFALSLEGRAVLVFVHGSSGMGKSALIHQFLRKLRGDHGDVVVLSGRCYERESVPYKALDSLVDALSRYLIHLPKNETEVLLPADVQALARLFPALRRLQAVARAQRDVLEIPDDRELKRRARTALRELFERLAERRPLVLYIDDLQWGDRDSADLLSELLRPPDPPPLLLVGCFRSEEKDTSPLLRRLLHSELIRESAVLRQLVLEELPEEHAIELARHLLGDSSTTAETVARAIARESRGSPYFIAELVRYARIQSGGGEAGAPLLDADSAGMTLERLLLTRLEKLTPESTRLLELVAVAGQPIELQSALQAGELGAAAQAAITLLRAASLIRIRRSRAIDQIECYHDRIREAVVGVLEPETRVRHHGSLALALEASGRADPEALAFHFHEAGELEREAHFVTSAADQAAEALAFDRAARLYRSALDLAEHAPLSRRQLLIKLGDALTNAGRGAEAARAYLDAAPGAQAAQALELRRLAAEQQLMSGHIDDGLETIRRVLTSIGMKMPQSRIGNLTSLLWRRLRLRLRGLDYTERDPSQLSPDQLIRIDTCRSIAIGLGNVYPIRGMDFATRHLLLALEAGEPYRVARGLALEAGFSSVDGTRTRRRTAGLTRAALTLAERVGEPSAIGLAHLSAAAASYLEGDGGRAIELFDRAEEILRNSCTGVTWELDTLMLYKFRLLVFLGRLGTLFAEVPAALKDVMERGDIYAEAGLRSNVGWLLRLASGLPGEALEEIHSARESWSQEGFHLNHYLHLVGQAEVALYRGESPWELVESSWPALVRSQLLRVQVTRTEAWHLRCRSALAQMCTSGTWSGKPMKVLTASLRRLERQSHPWAAAWARLIRAGLTSANGSDGDAIDHLVAAAAGFERRHMALYAAASRRRRGQLTGSDGAGFIDDADRWMREQGIEEPARFAEVLVPGRWER
ncbi:MAG: AAA family ATPase [bacterium]|nr:AAA family ATPase [bacterium]